MCVVCVCGCGVYVWMVSECGVSVCGCGVDYFSDVVSTLITLCYSFDSGQCLIGFIISLN